MKWLGRGILLFDLKQNKNKTTKTDKRTQNDKISKKKERERWRKKLTRKSFVLCDCFRQMKWHLIILFLLTEKKNIQFFKIVSLDVNREIPYLSEKINRDRDREWKRRERRKTIGIYPIQTQLDQLQNTHTIFFWFLRIRKKSINVLNCPFLALPNRLIEEFVET